MGVESEYEANTGPNNYIEVIPSTKNPYKNHAKKIHIYDQINSYIFWIINIM